MYVPGFSPYLADRFTGPVPGLDVMGGQPMGLAPEAPFAQVTAPVPAAGTRPFRIEQFDMTGDGGYQRNLASTTQSPGFTGTGPTFVEENRVGRAIGPQDNPFFIGEFNGQLGEQARTNRGNIAGVVPFDPNNQYRLVNNLTGEVVSSGAGEEGFINAMNASGALSGQGGRKANWSLFTADPSGQFRQVAADTPDRSALGQIADFALPILGAIALPGVGGVLGGALGSGLGAAGGSALSSIAQGRSLGDTLLRAGLSGLGAGVGAGALGAPFAGKAGTLAASSAGSAAAVPGEILVQGARSALPALAGGAGGALGSVGNEILVQGARAPIAGVASPIGAALPFALPQAAADAVRAAQQPRDEIVVERGGGLPPAAVIGGIGGLGALATAAGGGAPGEIVVERAAPTSPSGNPMAPPVVPPASGVGDLQAEFDEEFGKGQPEQKKSTLDKITDILQAAGLGAGLIGGLFEGGGGQGALAAIPGGLGRGQLNPVFGSQLPAASLPGAASSFAPRQPASLDWNRYGYGPEQSFFSYVPQTQVSPRQQPQGYAMGGGVEAFAVRGPGTGRSDEIPALLSDGEYVIDAETVALLGDGSSEAGADRLDQMREAVRRHKGQHLAKGNFSPDAKAPEHYLYGGRA